MSQLPIERPKPVARKAALTQTGCVSETGTGGACTDGTALDGAGGVVVSPDGTHVYVVSDTSDAVVTFARDTTTGALTQLGCISENGTGGACTDGTALDSAEWVAISPDGSSIYVVASRSDAVTVFARDTTTGALTRLGCISETGTGGACTDGTALDGPVWAEASPDGTHVYIASEVSSAVVIFARDTTTGALTQTGCISETGTGGACTDGTALDGPVWAEASPDGTHVYVASLVSNAVAVFARDTTTGDLAQLGCISEDGTDGVCTDGVALSGFRHMVVSPDGANAYAATGVSDAVVVFDRAP